MPRPRQSPGMADYSTASNNAQTGLNNATSGGLVERYRIGNREVQRGSALGQLQAAFLLEGMAARRSSGLYRLAKFKDARS